MKKRTSRNEPQSLNSAEISLKNKLNSSRRSNAQKPRRLVLSSAADINPLVSMLGRIRSPELSDGAAMSKLLLLFAFFKPAPHTVTLSWNASLSGGTVNVYRAPASCATNPYYSRIALDVVSTGPYSDSVSAGTYSYYVTAEVNGLESVPSNCVDVSIKGGPR